MVAYERRGGREGGWVGELPSIPYLALSPSLSTVFHPPKLILILLAKVDFNVPMDKAGAITNNQVR
jgi:hypothetical protein